MNNQIEDFDEFDEKNADAESRRSGAGLPRITYVNSAPKYDGTSIAGGGFLASVVEGVKPPAGWEEIVAGDRKSYISPSLECAVIAISPYTRRFYVAGEENGKEWVAGHVDFEQSFWKNLSLDVKANYQTQKGTEPSYRVSLFVVLKSDPSQVWELGLKSGNASAMFGITDQLVELAHYQTERLGKLRSAPYKNDLYPFINWVTFVAGFRLQYPTRKLGDEPRSFNRFSIAWPGSGEVKKFQREFIKHTDRGQSIDHWAEWHAAKKLLGDEDYSAMCVGLGNYGNFREKRGQIDKMLMEGYIRPLESIEEVEAAIEDRKRRYFERSISVNSRQLPAASAPVDNGPRTAEDWEDAKREAASNPPPPTPTEQPKYERLPAERLKHIAKQTIVTWGRATELQRKMMIEGAEAQYWLRMDEAFDWGDSPKDAKNTADLLMICAGLDEIRKEEGTVTY